MTTTVDQFLPILIGRDAVGRHALAAQRVLQDAGIRSRIYTGSSEDGFGEEVRPVGEWRPDPASVALYHLATGSPIADDLVERAPRLVIDHHNITPPHHFAMWSPEMAQGAAWGLRQMHALAARAELGVADSAFNASELAAAGCTRTAVAPILFDPRMLGGAGRAEPTLSDAAPVWLFVGRLAPNKAHDDVIRAFQRYRERYAPDAHLRLVGSPSPPSYEAALGRLVAALGLEASVDLCGRVTDDELSAHYRSADVFVCLSRHEGFCVPVLEAFHHDLPVIALSAGALPETVGDGGILVDVADPDLVAAAAHLVVADPLAREVLVERGRRRLASFDPRRTGERFLEALAPVLEA